MQLKATSMQVHLMVLTWGGRGGGGGQQVPRAVGGQQTGLVMQQAYCLHLSINPFMRWNIFIQEYIS